MNTATNQELIHGIDLSFDARFALGGTKDVVQNPAGDDFAYVTGIQQIAQELQRLFDLTPRGSFVDDPTYGIDLEQFVGSSTNPTVAIALCKVEVLRALSHPSFEGRLRCRYLEVQWTPEEPRVLWVGGILELFGFANVQFIRFGQYSLRYLT